MNFPVFVVIVLLLIFGGSMVLSKMACHARWEQSGMATSWGVIQGCLVKLPDGRWVPDDRVREFDLQRKETPSAPR